MQFPDRFKEEFIQELEIIKNKIDSVSNQSYKVYYLSGIGGFINRVINFEYNIELLLIERALYYCQSRIQEEIKNRLKQTQMLSSPSPEQLKSQKLLLEQKSEEITSDYFNPEKIPLTLFNPKFFELLSDYIEELKLAVEKEEDILKPIEKIVELTYTLTGNGRYLLKKGVISLDLE